MGMTREQAAADANRTVAPRVAPPISRAQSAAQANGSSAFHGNVQSGQVLPLPGTGPASQPPTAFDWERAIGQAAGGTVGATAGFAAGGPVLGILGGGGGAAVGGELVDQARRFPGLKEPVPPLLNISPPAKALYQLGRAAFEGPADVPSRSVGEVAGQARDAFREGAAGGALGFLARGPLAVLEGTAKAFGRGLRTRPAAEIAVQQYRAAQAAAGVTDASGPIATFFAEMGKMAGLGAGAEIVAQGLNAGGAAIATTVLRLPEATKAVLTNSPAFARWALSRGLATPLGAASQGVGQAGVQVGEAAGFDARDADALLEVMGAEGQVVAGAVRDFIRAYAEQEQGESQ